ncbi:MAG: hypothetical protein AABX16_05115 [Nanoarchaeota archaeon]
MKKGVLIGFFIFVVISIFVGIAFSQNVSNSKVCASYYRTDSSTTMIQGSWTSGANFTSSIQSCFKYMDENILTKTNCLQPNGRYITVILIEKFKHSNEMPVFDMSTEFVTAQFCPTSDISDKVCATYYRTAESDRMVQGTWINEEKYTSSTSNCLNYMKENILEKVWCAQPQYPTKLHIVIIDKNKHTFDMPAINVNTEFVYETTCKACTDSDGGKNYYVKGFALNASNSQASIDKCNNQVLTEYYCDGVLIKSEDYTCSNGCNDGACIVGNSSGNQTGNQTCFDSDGGLNYYTKGKVSSANGDIDDSCILSQWNATTQTRDFKEVKNCNSDSSNNSDNKRDECMIKEALCIDNKGSYEIKQTCSSGCNDGACIVLELKSDDSGDEEEIQFSGENKVLDICQGCELNNKCYPYGFREDNTFCSSEKEMFIAQLKTDALCENSFECLSNICADGFCVEEGLFQKIINWFRDLFGY